MTTMVALVGEQPQPNYLPVLHDKPESVMFVYTEKTRQKYVYLKIVLEKQGINIDGIETDPYDISAIAMTLDKSLTPITALAPQSLVFNLTGGTKPMSLAAYQVAAQRNAPIIYQQSERERSTIYYYNWQSNQLCYQRQEQLSHYPSLYDILHLHLGPAKDTEGKDIWANMGPTIQGNDGHLFELAIAQILKDHGYEVMCGVKGRNNQLDIDVLVRNQNQIGIIEAKTGKKAKGLEGVRQLSLAMRYLGGTYIRQFLILNGESSQDQQMMCELLNIQIISLTHYQLGTNFLQQDDIDTLLAGVDKVMRTKISRS